MSSTTGPSENDANNSSQDESKFPDPSTPNTSRPTNSPVVGGMREPAPKPSAEPVVEPGSATAEEPAHVEPVLPQAPVSQQDAPKSTNPEPSEAPQQTAPTQHQNPKQPKPEGGSDRGFVADRSLGAAQKALSEGAKGAVAGGLAGAGAGATKGLTEGALKGKSAIDASSDSDGVAGIADKLSKGIVDAGEKEVKQRTADRQARKSEMNAVAASTPGMRATPKKQDLSLRPQAKQGLHAKTKAQAQRAATGQTSSSVAVSGGRKLKKLSAALLFGVPTLLALGGLFLLLSFGGATTQPSGAALLPSDALQAEEGYSQDQVELFANATEGTRVPWTLLAGLAETATSQGETSPYDTCNRSTGEGCEEGVAFGVFPTITPPIVGDGDDAGVGPYLLPPSLAGRNPQSLEDASETMAQLLWAIAEERTEPSYEDLEEAYLDIDIGDLEAREAVLAQLDAFWAEVTNEIEFASFTGTPTAAGSNASACLPAIGTPTAQTLIPSAFTCALGDIAELEILVQEGVTVSGAQAIAQLNADAAQISFRFSNWETSTCDPTAQLAGIFPLTQTQFDTNTPEGSAADRCDDGANIKAAAAIVAAAVSDGYGGGTVASIQDPWVAFPVVFGDSNTQAEWAASLGRFDANALTDADQDCVRLVVTELSTDHEAIRNGWNGLTEAQRLAQVETFFGDVATTCSSLISPARSAALAPTIVQQLSWVIEGDSTGVPTVAEGTPTETRPVLILGDSLCTGALNNTTPSLRTRLTDTGFTSVTATCRAGGTVAWAINQVNAQQSVPANVLITLGKDETASVEVFRTQVAALRDALQQRGAESVNWISVDTRDGDFSERNQALLQPGIRVVDWAGQLAANPQYYGADGVHYYNSGQTGADAFASYLVSAVDGSAVDVLEEIVEVELIDTTTQEVPATTETPTPDEEVEVVEPVVQEPGIETEGTAQAAFTRYAAALSGTPSSTETTNVVVGSTALADRFSAGRLSSRPPSLVSSATSVLATNTGTTATQWAVYFGGIIVGDHREGNPPSAGSFGVSTGVGGLAFERKEYVIGQAGIQERIEPRANYRVWFLPEDEFVELGDCGGTYHYAIIHPDYVPYIDRLCRDAEAAGISVPSFGGAGRTLAVQINLRVRNGCPDIWSSGASSCRVATARPGQSYHQVGLAIDMTRRTELHEWVHDFVGCYNTSTTEYTAFAYPVTRYNWSSGTGVVVTDKSGNPITTCGVGERAVKRINTYGLVFNVSSEDWHVQIGEPVPVSGADAAIFSRSGSCSLSPTLRGTDRQAVAQYVWETWYCAGAGLGYEQLPPVSTVSFNGNLQFSNLAQQLAAEAVTTAWCESRFDNTVHANTSTAAGLWQFLTTYHVGPGLRFETAAQRYDIPISNNAAIEYFIDQGGINTASPTAPAGWHPWQAANPNLGGSRSAILGKQSILPRLRTDGRLSPLPSWAVDPFSLPVGTQGCGSIYDGGAWS